LIFCSGCGAVIGTKRYLTFIRDRLGSLATAPQNADGPQCDVCARKKGHQGGSTVMATT